MPPPQMRASYMISNLKALERLGPKDERAVRATVPDVVREIEESVSIAWLPLELDVRMTEAVEQVCGGVRLRRWCAEAMVDSMSGPLLRPMLSAVQRMGITPHTALRRTPYGWKLIYRNCGALDYNQLDARSASIVLRAAPPQMTGETYLNAIAGTFEGVIEVAGCAYSATEISKRGGNVVFECEWVDG